MNGRLLWLDDLRDPNVYYTPLPELPQFVLWVETAPAAVLALQTTDWDEVSLDHDLGDDPGAGDGYDVLLWIESEVRLNNYKPPKMTVHTSNPVARQRMQKAIEAITSAC